MDFLEEDEKYKYVDDLSILEFICLSGLLVEYDVHSHVPSNVGVDQLFLPSASFDTQSHLGRISSWTAENLMQLNEEKSNYMILSRSIENFATRLTLNSIKLEQLHDVRLLGVIIQDDLKWDSNTADVCKRAFARLSMITKLKYVGVRKEDLLDVYCLYVRSLLEYCCVVWHSALTKEQTTDLERVQKTSLKIILGDEYSEYKSALNQCILERLSNRREKRCLKFGLKATKHPKHQKLFPLNQEIDLELRDVEKYHVNFARTSTYKKSSIPYIQRLLNKHHIKKLP